MSAVQGVKRLKEHVQSVSSRMHPSIRKHSRSLRPAWVEARVADLPSDSKRRKAVS